MSFEKLDIRPEIVKALKHDGVETPTDIQLQTIPLIKQGKDVIGISNTGSGKTIAFTAPLIDMIKPGEGLQVIVIVPVRELAVQISKEFAKFGKDIHLRVATVFGGVGMQPQIDALVRAEVIVCTPGRTLDHLQRGTLDLSKIWCAVIDEADKMVEMGFIEDISEILNQTPDNRQVLLFGATVGEEVEHLRDKYMHNPVLAKAELRVKEDLLKQFYYDVKQNEKFSLLVHLLRKDEFDKTLIFCSTRSTVEMLTRNLKKHDFKAAMIHGKLSQNRRLYVIEQFNKGEVPLLIASAVAARGLHIENVTHIINYDLSQDPEEYIHRIGRTARAGESGKAITLLSDRDYDAFDQIHRKFDVKIELLPREEFARIAFDTGRSRMQGGQGRYGHSGGGQHRARSSSPHRSGSSSPHRTRSGGQQSRGREAAYMQSGSSSPHRPGSDGQQSAGSRDSAHKPRKSSHPRRTGRSSNNRARRHASYGRQKQGSFKS